MEQVRLLDLVGFHLSQSIFQPGGPGILARGLYLVGATWDREKNLLVIFKIVNDA